MATSTTVNTIFMGVSLFFLSRLRGSEGKHLGARAAQEQRRAPAQQHRATDAEQVLLDGLDLIELLVIEREPVAVLHEHLLAVNRQARDGAGGLALTEFVAGGIDRDELLGAAGAVAAEREGDKAVALGGVVIQIQVAEGVLGGELCVIVKEGQARLRHAADLAAAPEEVGKEFIGARGAAALVFARERERVHDTAGILQAERGEILPVRAHGGAHEVARAGIPDIDGLAGGVIHRDGALIARGVRADGKIAAVAQVGADDLAGGLDIGLVALEIRHAQRRSADVIGAHALAADGDARLREREDLVQDGLAVFIEQLQAARGHDREAAVYRAEGAAGAGVERVGRAVVQIVARRAGPVAHL